VNWKEVRPYLEYDFFNYDAIRAKNSSAAGLVSWVRNIVMYHDIVTTVEPKRKALAAAKFNHPKGVCACADGSVWVADQGNNCIRRIASDGTVSTVAGVAGSKGHADGEGSAAKFSSPCGVCACADGSVWVADYSNHCIRRISSDGTVSTVAGVAGSAGRADGEGSAAKFNHPKGVCACADGSVWVADQSNHCIRRIAADGTVSTVAGAAGSRGHATAVKFNHPKGVCACADGSVWVADQSNHCIRRIASDGTVSTVAGVTGSKGHADGKGSAAKFSSPIGVCACADGSVWVADQSNHCIRRISSDGTVSTVAGVAGSKGQADGEGFGRHRERAKFSSPVGVCTCADGSVWVADQGNHCIRRIAYPGFSGTKCA
jgi:streptogramin lyase